MKKPKNIYEVGFQILTLIIAIFSVCLTYFSIKTSYAIAKEQIDYTKYINQQKINDDRPFISITGIYLNILDKKNYQIEAKLINIGERPMHSLSLIFSLLQEENKELKYIKTSKYTYANHLDKGVNSSFIEIIPRENIKTKYYFKIIAEYNDVLFDTTYHQNYYFSVPLEQLKYAEKYMQGLVFGADLNQKELIDSVLLNDKNL